MTVQENYKEWFWSNLDEEGLKQNPDILIEQNISGDVEESIQASSNQTYTRQLNDYVNQIRQAAEQARLAEQEKHVEMLRVAAAMYKLQGDERGAAICKTIEDLIKATESPAYGSVERVNK